MLKITSNNDTGDLTLATVLPRQFELFNLTWIEKMIAAR